MGPEVWVLRAFVGRVTKQLAAMAVGERINGLSVIWAVVLVFLVVVFTDVFLELATGLVFAILATTPPDAAAPL